jgi:hypothetical protein
MTLDASGNLLVGTTDIDPTTNRTNGAVVRAAGGILIRNATGGSDWGLNVTSGTIVNFYSDDGSSRVLAGAITVNGNTTAYTSVSDYRLKNIVSPVSDSGSRIDALQPVEYEWKDGGTRTRGFLAHQFQNIYANSVSGAKDAIDEDGNPVYQSMQAGSSEVIADLVAELQSVRARLAALEAK